MENLIKQAKNKADDQLNFKKIVGGVPGVFIEMLDGALIGGALEFANKRIPDHYKGVFEIALKAYVSGDYSGISGDVAKRLNEAIDIPGINETQESILFKHVYLAFVEILESRDSADSNNEEGSVGGGGSGDDPTDPDGDED